MASAPGMKPTRYVQIGDVVLLVRPWHWSPRYIHEGSGFEGRGCVVSRCLSMNACLRAGCVQVSAVSQHHFRLSAGQQAREATPSGQLSIRSKLQVLRFLAPVSQLLAYAAMQMAGPVAISRSSWQVTCNPPAVIAQPDSIRCSMQRHAAD